MFFTTRTQDPADRAQAWRAWIVQHLGPVRLELEPGSADATAEDRTIGDIVALRLSCPDGMAMRTTTEITFDERDRYLVVLQADGNTEIEQAARSVHLEPGMAVLIDPARPSTFSWERSSAYVLRIPRARLNGRGVQWARRVAEPFPSTTGALLHSILRVMFATETELDNEQGQVVAEAIARLMCSGPPGEPEEGDTYNQTILLASVQAYVSAHLDDPDLSPATIARAHHISERQLYRLFEDVGHSIGRWIRAARLHRCARDLRDPALRDRSIAAIASSHGFAHAAHFSRTFREEFGETPTEYRSGANHRHLKAS